MTTETITREGFEIILDNDGGGAVIKSVDFHAVPLEIDLTLAEKILTAAKKKHELDIQKVSVNADDAVLIEVMLNPRNLTAVSGLI